MSLKINQFINVPAAALRLKPKPGAGDFHARASRGSGAAATSAALPSIAA